MVVWATQVIYYNNIYSANAFERRNYLDVVVYRSRAPLLTEHLQTFASKVVEILVEKNGGGKIREVVMLIYLEASLHIRRRYVLDFSQTVGLAGKLSSLDFLYKEVSTLLAELDIPSLNWDALYTHFRSCVFLHSEELKRTAQPADNDLFYKLILNVEDSVNLSTEAGQWIRLMLEVDTRNNKLVAVGEVLVGFLCFNARNEYI